jgi:hypothetical protein
MTRIVRRASQLALAAVLAGSTAGCSHFRESRKLDLTPFADNTFTTIGELQKFEKPAVWVFLRKYRTHPAVLKTVETYAPLRRLLRGIAFYSAQMVSLADASMSEDRKLKELARYLEVVVRPAAADEEASDWGITPADVDRIAAEIRQKKTFLEGVAAAEPLVNASLRYGLKLLDKVDGDIVDAANAIGQEVEAEFASVNANAADVERVQQELLHGFALLHQYRLGNDKALEQLRAAVPLARETLPGAKAPTTKQLDELETVLAAQLQRIEAATAQLAPDVARYEGSQKELDKLRMTNVERARLARVTLILWARSHRNLGLGVAVPPAIDLAGLIKSGAANATSLVF